LPRRPHCRDYRLGSPALLERPCSRIAALCLLWQLFASASSQLVSAVLVRKRCWSGLAPVSLRCAAAFSCACCGNSLPRRPHCRVPPWFASAAGAALLPHRCAVPPPSAVPAEVALCSVVHTVVTTALVRPRCWSGLAPASLRCACCGGSLPRRPHCRVCRLGSLALLECPCSRIAALCRRLQLCLLRRLFALAPHCRDGRLGSLALLERHCSRIAALFRRHQLCLLWRLFASASSLSRLPPWFARAAGAALLPHRCAVPAVAALFLGVLTVVSAALVAAAAGAALLPHRCAAPPPSAVPTVAALCPGVLTVVTAALVR
jgi:hypothetical protein